MKRASTLTASTLFVLTVAGISPAIGQIASGGSYVLERSVVANGGNSQTGPSFELTGTVGQPTAGSTSTGSPYNLVGGF